MLEAIVGMDFLPRGDGVVTRRPLELRLVHEPSPDTQSYAVFEARKDQKYTDFDKVRCVIDELTEEVAGKNRPCLLLINPCFVLLDSNSRIHQHVIRFCEISTLAS